MDGWRIKRSKTPIVRYGGGGGSFRPTSNNHKGRQLSTTKLEVSLPFQRFRELEAKKRMDAGEHSPSGPFDALLARVARGRFDADGSGSSEQPPLSAIRASRTPPLALCILRFVLFEALASGSCACARHPTSCFVPRACPFCVLYAGCIQQSCALHPSSQ